ncbi:MAG: hypothetical protein J6R80_02750, partial [Kiritimatiellae bacterium]|nr:hypothetical protein [Kiritimatiellia bacterium]
AAKDARIAAQKLAEAEASKLEEQTSRLQIEKEKTERAKAEASILENQRLDLLELARELSERERDVAEREQALRPEKTIADLAWVGDGEDSIIDEKGNIKKKPKVTYLAENDKSLPRGTRALARAERLSKEGISRQEQIVRDSIVKTLKDLEVQAVSDDRVVDAIYYRNILKSMYLNDKDDTGAEEPPMQNEKEKEK